MTTDELIAKLLDGTLTQGENSKLQAMIAASPELADEVRHLRTIEDILSRPQETKSEDAALFLHTVEDKIAASLVAAGGSVPVAQQLSNLSRTLFAPLLVVLGSIGVFLIVRPGTETPAPATAQLQPTTAPSFEMPAPSPEAQKNTHIERPAAQRSVAAKPRVRPNAERPATTNATSTNEIATNSRTNDGSALINTPLRPSKTIASIEKEQSEFDKAMRSGNKVQAAMSAHRLGLLYYSVFDSPQATSFLKTAVELSRETNMQEYEAKSLGQLGLIARKDGDATAADTYMRDCISLLEKLDNAKLLKEWNDRFAKSAR